MTADLADTLATRLSTVLGTPVVVEGLQRLSGGANRETWALTAVTGDGARRELVLRGGAGTGGVDLSVEVEVMTAARRAGVPVPEIVDTGRLERPYLLMERVDGETIPRRILRDPALTEGRARLAADFGPLLARLHAVPLAEVSSVRAIGDPLAHLHSAYAVDTDVDTGVDTGVDAAGGPPPPPGLALGLRWLADHRPPEAGEVLVHGDFRLGNLMVGPDGLRAVLDWELVHVGDPVEDLGWLCAKVWRFGSPLPAGGVGSREELLDGYAAVAGWRPTDAQLHWWEVYATVRWGLMCGAMASRHLSGAEPSVELAAIGRRACEQEFDVLLALGMAAPEEPPAEPVERFPADLYGRPTAAELVAAARLFLDTEVRPETGGRLSFHARVAANVLGIAYREQLLGGWARDRHDARLDRLACADDPELGEAILSGTLDDRWAEVVDAVRESVRDRVLVANPRHLGRPA